MENGKGPILVEPVKGSLTFSARAVAAVNILDHSGRRTDKTLPVSDGRFQIDGSKDHALYYEVVFP